MVNKLLNFIHNIIPPGTTFGIKRSGKWYSIRKSFLENNPQCAFCTKTKDLQVHHIIPVHINPELELDISNFMTLCSHDHFTIGHFCNWSSYNITVIEDCDLFRQRIIQRPNR